MIYQHPLAYLLGIEGLALLRGPPGDHDQAFVTRPGCRPGDWADWPWTLLPLVPEASRAAWDQPSTIIWQFQLDDR